MPVKSQQQTPPENSGVRGRTQTIKTIATKVASFTSKRASAGAIRSGRSRTSVADSKRSHQSTPVKTERTPEELIYLRRHKIISEVNDKNIDEVLNLSDFSHIPKSFLTEIEQDDIYATILEELQKKKSILNASKNISEQQDEEEPISPDFMAVDDENKNISDEISYPISDEHNTKISNDGYDTDIEIESPVKQKTPISGKDKYRKLCEKGKLVPCSYFMAHINKDEMVLRYHQFSTDDIRAITKTLTTNYNVERLFLDGNYLQEQAAQHIAKLIISNDFITELSLVDNRLGGGEGTKEICRMLTLNQNLKKINLSGNKFNELDVAQLIEAFERNTTLRELDLSHNCFGEKCGEMLGAFISGNDSLEYINLGWNNFREQSAIDMIGGITENTRLRRCNLEMNGFGPSGGQILAECIKKNTVLEELNINGNRLNTQNAFAIGQALSVNDTLQVLKIADNQINSDGALAVFLCIKANETNRLREIDFSHTVVTQETVNICEDIKKLKNGNFKYQVGKVTPELLKSNADTICYIKTNTDLLKKLRTNAAKVKPNEN
ncbi:unnamed protein product [Adineta steineri]|uniref:Uncharacterized protein n=1 Tax=Adineta steineri TaxID=433720 RepID=A0A813V085_9BILA|nr:unnamed protein product [Adineta steineri]CAF0870920.1 unnamed protein product [Adineta steineri]